MRSSLIEVRHICLEETIELLLMQDQEMIQAFSPHAPKKAFTDSIRSRSSVRCPKHFDATRGSYMRKTRPKFAVIIPNQIVWFCSIRSRLSQLLRNPGIGGRSGHIHVDDLARFQFDDKEGKKRTEEEVRDLQKIASPNLCRMIAQKRLPVLSSRFCAANLAHVFLNGPFTHPDIQLEEFPTDALCSPESVVYCYLLDQADHLE
jgi:hypothetical protein